jgi:hypothetical protein
MNLTVRNTLQGCDNKIPKRIFGPKKEEVTIELGKEHNERFAGYR